MSINTNLNRMARTTVIRIAQIIAAAWLVLVLPWPQILGVVLTHAYEVTAMLIPWLAKLAQRVLPMKTEQDNKGQQ